MPIVIANDLTLNYEQQGTGQPLILIPYLAADHACYAFQVAEYARHFTCISLDLRGTGGSDKPPAAYTTELLADDVAAFMQAAGIGKAHVAGLSLGGAIGMWLAAKYPDKVQSLALHSAWPKSDAFQRTIVESWQIVAKAVGVPDMIIQAIFPWCFTPELYAERPDYIESLAAFVRSRPPQSVPDFILQSNAVLAPRCDRSSRANHRADADHLRAPRSADVDALRGCAQGRHPQCRAARLRRVRARAALRACRGIQSEDAGVPAPSHRRSGRIARR